ncbi:hypothetical protein BGZ70_007322 [Mortierella alpina]|uniref:BTB domain-containing protein n=1 Tax=Mortierella alpina TaxID=64518 RepID=A0A9P6J6E0_MORAP|nr:hypothetical protein BGZ70_007322 [Mortierella alpina]
MAAAAAAGAEPHRTAADPRYSRIVTHWARSSPEEGIQLHLRCADVQRTGTAFHIRTDPPSADKPCQWSITLSPVHKVTSAPSVSPSSAPASRPVAPSRTHPVEAEKPGTRSQPESEPTTPSLSSSSSTLLLLTLERVVPQAVEMGIDQVTESPTSPSRVRCELYRTLYIYSPKLKRDICVHPVKKHPWPQNVVFDGMDVSENDGKEYHFQIWLSGSNPRQEDTRTAAKFNHMQQLLRAMRKDSATANVEIVIKNRNSQDPGHLGTTEGFEDRRKTETAKGGKGKDSTHHVCNTGVGFGAQDETHWRYDNHHPRPKKTCFKAHKCVLEVIPFFSRMLNGGFREGLASPRGMHKIELSDDMFDASIMDHLLDYLYTHELAVDDSASPQKNTRARAQSLGGGTEAPAPSTYVHHIISANVGLNLQTVISETRLSNPRNYGYSAQERHSTQANAEAPSLTLKQWGALYKAGVHLEDKVLQAVSMETIKARLDPETTLDQVLSWGHQHEEIKTMMVQYLVKKRRHVFGEEHTNKLRPYLWAEYEDQVETLVEITSLMARQPE